MRTKESFDDLEDTVYGNAQDEWEQRKASMILQIGLEKFDLLTQIIRQTYRPDHSKEKDEPHAASESIVIGTDHL